MTDQPTTSRTRRGTLLVAVACVVFLGLIVGLAVVANRALTPEPTQAERWRASFEDGIEYLIQTQQDDGSWRSEHYSVFNNDRVTLTALNLKTLTFARSELNMGGEALNTAIERAWASLTSDLAGRDPSELDLHYPAYSASLVVLALARTEDPALAPARESWLDLLRAHQHGAHNGFMLDDAAFGGWGNARTIPDASSTRPHEADISTTLFAVGALRLAGASHDDPAIQDALAFVERCRYKRGGFFFSPTTPVQNKAGATDRFASGRTYNPYGSPTADAIRCLLRCGVDLDDHRLTRAVTWLESADWSTNPGDFPSARETDRRSTFYYWAWSAAHATRALTDAAAPSVTMDTKLADLADQLVTLQRDDGSWANPAGGSMENDQLVATPLALGTLGVALR